MLVSSSTCSYPIVSSGYCVERLHGLMWDTTCMKCYNSRLFNFIMFDLNAQYDITIQSLHTIRLSLSLL